MLPCGGHRSAVRFISEFNQDNGGTVLGSHAPQHLQQLQQLRQRLKDAVVEIERLQGESAGPASPQRSPEKDASLSSSGLPGLPADALALGDEGSNTSHELRQSLGISSGSAAANAGGTVTGTVARITQEAVKENAVALAKVKEDQRRLQALQKEVADLQRDNEAASLELASRDVRGLREQAQAQQAQLREARSAEEELRQLEALPARLPQMRAEAEALRPVASEAGAQEQELKALRELDARRVQLSRDIATLQPKVGDRLPSDMLPVFEPGSPPLHRHPFCWSSYLYLPEASLLL